MRLIGTAATGIRAQQVALDTIANNIANANTPGFKEETVNFAEALAAQQRLTNANGTALDGLSVGAGVLYNGLGADFRPGTLVQSENPLDLAIEGEGFFQVRLANGQNAYTRAGMFQLDSSSSIVDPQGNMLDPQIKIPAEATNISVSPEGKVTGLVNGQPKELGQIGIARFSNPEGLEKLDSNLYMPTGASGVAQTGNPGSGDLGKLRAQALEQSNVDMAKAMTDLIQVQRAYQVNARLVADGDKMWGIANSLRR